MDLTLILIAAVLVFIVVQVLQGRKRRRETVERTSKFTPGVEIMTNYGLYGTIVSIDDEKNLAVLETSPGVTIKVHRQTILKVADYDTPVEEEETDPDAVDGETLDSESPVVIDPARDPDDVDDTASAGDRTTGDRTEGTRAAATRAEPRFGERVEDPGTARGTGSGTTPGGKADD